MAGLFPTIAVEVELSGVGGGWTDLRAAGDVFKDAGIVIRHGIQGSAPTDRVAATGTASVALRNSTLNSGGVVGYYSPHHASVRSGWGLGIGFRIRMQDPDTTTWHTRFIGKLDAIDPVPGIYRERVVHLTAVDWMDEAARWKLTPEVGEQANQDWSAVLTAILAEMPVQPTASSFDSGTENYTFALDTSSFNTPALSEFVKLANSEFGLIYVTAAGTLTAEGRHVRMVDTAADWTLTDASYQDLELPSTRDDIINTVRVTTHPKIVDGVANQRVYAQANVITFAAAQSRDLIGPYRDETTGEPIGATDIQPLVAGVDYTANASADGSGTDVSSDFVVVVSAGASGVRFTVTNNNASTAHLTSLELTGKRVLEHGTATQEATYATCISSHGEHVVTFDMPYQEDEDVGQGAADYILAKYKDPLAQARSIRVLGKTTALLTQILTRDISDRITLSETVTGVSDDFYINGVELMLTTDGYLQADYILTPAQDPFAGNYFEIDTSALDGADVLAPF